MLTVKYLQIRHRHPDISQLIQIANQHRIAEYYHKIRLCVFAICNLYVWEQFTATSSQTPLGSLQHFSTLPSCMATCCLPFWLFNDFGSNDELVTGFCNFLEKFCPDSVESKPFSSSVDYEQQRIFTDIKPPSHELSFSKPVKRGKGGKFPRAPRHLGGPAPLDYCAAHRRCAAQ